MRRCRDVLDRTTGALTGSGLPTEPKPGLEDGPPQLRANYCNATCICTCIFVQPCKTGHVYTKQWVSQTEVHTRGFNLTVVRKTLIQGAGALILRQASMMGGTKRVAQACDACRLRKVKCNGQQRCSQCSHLNLRCVYRTKQQKRNAFKRGRLISEYKQRSSNGASPSDLPSRSGLATKTMEEPLPVVRMKSAASGCTTTVPTASDHAPLVSPGDVWLGAESRKFKHRALA